MIHEESPNADGYPLDNDIQPSSDEQLLVRIHRGDRKAFEELFLHFAPRLADFVYRYVGSQDEAQDIVQDIFLRLWRLRDSLNVRGTLSDYLYLAARNSVRNRFAHQRVVQAWEQHTVTMSSERDIQPDPLDLLEASERHAEIMRVLSEFPERRRIICTLRWVHGLRYAEIAQRLGISERTVNAQLDRGFRELKKRFFLP